MAETKESVFDFTKLLYIIIVITIHNYDYIIGYVCQLIIAIVMIAIILYQ